MSRSPSFLGPSHSCLLVPHSSIPTWFYYFFPLNSPYPTPVKSLWRHKLCNCGHCCNQALRIGPLLNICWTNICLCAQLLQLCTTLCDPMVRNLPVSPPWDSPGKNTRGGNHDLLQGLVLTQELNLHLLFAGRFFTCWATREPLNKCLTSAIKY